MSATSEAKTRRPPATAPLRPSAPGPAHHRVPTGAATGSTTSRSAKAAASAAASTTAPSSDSTMTSTYRTNDATPSRRSSACVWTQGANTSVRSALSCRQSGWRFRRQTSPVDAGGSSTPNTQCPSRGALAGGGATSSFTAATAHVPCLLTHVDAIAPLPITPRATSHGASGRAPSAFASRAAAACFGNNAARISRRFSGGSDETVVSAAASAAPPLAFGFEGGEASSNGAMAALASARV
mmetsp:Transcript_8854/g.20065  ORF Transcript_8854/g.20065 Transcript_8854/m.20065 type:complete len:240 (+) Transcript_8854:336-1055(+)